MHCTAPPLDVLASPMLGLAHKASQTYSGHGFAQEERRLNHGLQHTLSGRGTFPVPRSSPFHRSINQKLPELWADFSDRGLPDARAGHDDRSTSYHNGFHGGAPVEPCSFKRTNGWHGSLAGRSPSPEHAAATARSGQCVFVGFAEFDMDGRHQTAGEMDRIMAHAAASKYPCSRPATLDEYERCIILGLPPRNRSGKDVVFSGPGATGCELFHTNTLGSQKCMVPPGDVFDGQTAAASLNGRKCCLCVYPVARVKRQQSLTQFGLARETIGKSGRLRRAGSLSAISDTTKWTRGEVQV